MYRAPPSPPEKSEGRGKGKVCTQAWEGRSSYTLKPVNSASRSRPPNKPPLYGDLFYYWFLSWSIVGVSLKSVRYSRLRFKVSAQANFAHFCIIFSGCFMDNIYMSLH